MHLRRKIRDYYPTQVEKTAGKYLFGNMSGVRFNIKDASLKSACRLTALNMRTDSATGKEIRRRGYAKMEGEFPAKVVQDIQKQFDNIIEDPSHSEVRAERGGVAYSRIVRELHKAVPSVFDLLTPNVDSIVEGYFGSPYRIAVIYGWRNRHVPQEIAEADEIFSDRWHCDSSVADRLKLFIYLGDVGYEHGPLHVQSIDRSKWLMRRSRPGVHREAFGTSKQSVDDPSHVVRCTGPAGTSFFVVTGKCLHRAGIPGPERVRDIIQFQFLPTRRKLFRNESDLLSSRP
jgi:hypothetical protein